MLGVTPVTTVSPICELRDTSAMPFVFSNSNDESLLLKDAESLVYVSDNLLGDTLTKPKLESVYVILDSTRLGISFRKKSSNEMSDG